jgi:phosphate transport system substrate-binding protein
MQYIECDGQREMAHIGYSPLPPNLSQEMSNSIARMRGTKPVVLTAQNCSNPRFHGGLGDGSTSPDDPLKNVPEIGGGPASGGGGPQQPTTPGTGATGNALNNTPSRSSNTKGRSTQSSTLPAAGRKGNAPTAVGGGSGDYRASAPVAYDRPGVPSPSSWPAWALALIIVVPYAIGLSWFSVRRRRKQNQQRPPESP